MYLKVSADLSKDCRRLQHGG